MSRTLLLLRHATAGVALGRTDHARGLTAQGMAEAAAIGRAVSAHAPDLVLCSSAMRAQQTAAYMGTASPVLEQALYLASADELLDRIRQVPDEVSTVLVVGHNPGLAQLATTLDDDPRLDRALPTAALAVFAVPDGSWAGLRTARLTDLVLPGH